MTRSSVSIWPVLGFVASGLSGAVLVAASARGLTPPEFREVTLVWTGSTMFGVGLASPAEQATVRALSAGDRHASGPLRLLFASAVMSVVLVGGAFGVGGGGSVSRAALLSWVSVVVGWSLVTPLRAAAAGARKFNTYGASLFVEALARLGLAALGLMGHAGPSVFLLGLGCPLILAACYLFVAGRSFPGFTEGTRSGWVGEFGTFVIVSVCFQVCLSGPVFFVDWRFAPGGTETVGQFATASSYLRAPTLLVGGMTVQGLARMSLAWSRHDFMGLAATEGRLLRRGFLVAACGTGAGWLSAPLGLPLLYGRHLEIGGGVVAALAASTGLAMIGAVVVQRLLAVGDAWRAAGAWSAGAVTTCCTGGVWIAEGGRLDFAELGVVLIAGPAMVVGLLAVARRPTKRSPVVAA